MTEPEPDLLTNNRDETPPGALKGAAVATLIVAGGFAASKVLGLLRNVVIGHQYGASHDYEMFLAALTVPDTLFQILAGGAVGSAFIPVFTGLMARNDRAGAWRLVSTLANAGILALGGAAVVLAFLAPAIVAAIVPGWTPEDHARTANLIRIMLVSPALFALSTLATSTLNAMNRFALAAAAPLAYNLSLMAGAVFLRPFGVEGLAVSAAIGALLHLLVQVPGLIAVRLHYQPVLDIRWPPAREVASLMGPRMIGLGISQINQVVTVAFASFLGEGAIAFLSYAWLVITVPLGIGAMGIATATFPRMSRDIESGQPDSARRTFQFGAGVAVALCMLAAVALVILGRPIVGLLLERGAFGPDAAAATAFALACYAVGLPGHGTIEVTSRAFYAMRDTATPVRVAAVGGAINVGLSLVLMRTPLGYGGLALANGVAALTEAGLLLWLLERRSGWLPVSDVRAFIFRTTVVTLAFGVGSAAAATIMARYLTSTEWSADLIVLVVAGAAGAVLAALVGQLIWPDGLRGLRRLTQR